MDEYTLGLYAHDGMVSVVSVAPYTKGTEYVWVTFGEITPNGFSPCYATMPVRADEIKGVVL